MKKNLLTFMAFLLMTNAASAFMIEVNSSPKASNSLAVNTYFELSATEFEQQTGKKLTFFQKIGLKTLNRTLQKQLPPECSKIVMKDGDIIEANIIQISPTEIKYKRCGKPNDPELVIYKKDVLSVKAADGEIIFRNTEASNNANNSSNNNNNNNSNNNNSDNSNEQKADGSAIAGMICGILGVVLLGSILGLASGIVGIVLSLMGRRKIQRDPKRLKGKGMALAGLICGIVACGLFALALL
jgi:hypothetical protein